MQRLNHDHYIENSMRQLSQVVETRLVQYFANPDKEIFWDPVIRPELNGFHSHLKNLLNTVTIELEEYLVFLLALAPHVKPHLMDSVIAKVLPESGDFPQLGGVRGKNHRGFMPTGETALFLLAGDDIEKRARLQRMFDPDHWFSKRQVLWLSSPHPGEPILSGKMNISQEFLDLISRGKITRPRFGIDFPAQMIETQMDWDDLVLNDHTSLQITELKTWMKHGNTLMKTWGMEKKLKPGYRSLFYGPPGTGKTLTASLLGKHCQKDVYRIDLSMVISKYIGETEKNLSNLFNKAENKDWILFFDEADALFGKRTNVKDAHDKYANQEVSYLLQRVENYGGLVILASNQRKNIDDAFTRRFQSIIHFPMPSDQERRILWQKAFPDAISLDNEVNLNEISQRYNISGANIMNIVQYCCLEVLRMKQTSIDSNLLISGIKREFEKEGKLL